MKKVYLLPLLLLPILTVSAQCLVQKVALEERIHTTDYILEGKRIGEQLGAEGGFKPPLRKAKSVDVPSSPDPVQVPYSIL